LAAAEAAYRTAVPREPAESPDVHALYQYVAHILSGQGNALIRRASSYRDWLGGGVGSDAARLLLHTHYHAVEKTPGLTALATQW
jgi:hypothetical protein